MLAIKNLGENEVVVTQPWSITRQTSALSAARGEQSAPVEGHLCIVFNVPAECPPNEVAAESGANWVKRITPVDTTAESRPYTLILSFSDIPPPYITVAGFLRLRTHDYIPRPMRCLKCWAFGHTAKRCQKTVVCCYCGKRGHAKEQCTLSQNPESWHCDNCHGGHEAASRDCPKYIENMKIIKLAHSTQPPMPFKEAQEKWLLQKPHTVHSANVVTTASNSAEPTGQTTQTQTMQQTLIDKNQLESLVFGQLLMSNIIKNLGLLIFGENSETIQILSNALSGVASETAHLKLLPYYT